ncbi:MAG: hypothetical protein RQ824_05355 [bacterium]|nr:hypothetical protein [bacterium]
MKRTGFKFTYCGAALLAALFFFSKTASAVRGMSRIYWRSCRIGTVPALLAALLFSAGMAEAKDIDPLYLYAAPSKGGRPGNRGGDGHDHSAPQKKRQGPPAAGGHSSREHGKTMDRAAETRKISSPQAGYGDKSKGLKKYEPAMRPTPKRSYILSDKDISENAKALLMLADGSMGEAKIVRGKDKVLVEIETGMEDGPSHGANNVYVVDKKVSGGTLYIRTAKWINIHHSCGWGHDYRYDEQRSRPKSLDAIPLEITFDKLWSGNLHAEVLSGDRLGIEALHFGKPAPGAKISVTTEQQWTKRLRTDENGKASFRLIEDYFAQDWSEFKRRNTGAFTVVASYDTDESGEYEGEKYDKVSIVTTFHWKYNPAAVGYMSYSAGLYAGIFTIGIGGLGIFYHRQRRKKPLKEAHLDEKA